MSRTDLTKKQWRKLEPHLPSDPRYGPWQICYDRFVRWSRNGTWQRLLKIMQAAADKAEPPRLSWRPVSVSQAGIPRLLNCSTACNGLPQLAGGI